MADAAKEAEELKQAFRRADVRGDGRLSRADLVQLFQDLEAEWRKEDLEDIFDAVDPRREGLVDYCELVDWVMGEESGAPVAGTQDDDSDSDADEEDGAQIQVASQIAASGLDLGRRFSLWEWVAVMRHLGEDEGEATEMYEKAAKDAQHHGKDVSTGLPLSELLDDLQIEPEDREGLHHLGAVIAAADKEASGTGGPAAARGGALPGALDKVVKMLEQLDRPAEDAWLVATSGKVALSKAGSAAIRDFAHRQGEFVAKVKDYAANPPLLNSTAGQVGNREHCVTEVEAIIQRCRSTGSKFTDPEWDLVARPLEALYVDKKAPGYDCTVGKPAGYKRLTEIVANPVLFKGGVKPGDIMQGRLGTCFLLGAVGTIASRADNAIAKVFIRYDIEVGVYGVRFCLDGEWAHVIVDDVMPVDAHGRPLYARCKDPQEVWCPLLEKAYCKLHTCYEMCDGGRPNEACYSLCGGACGKFPISKEHRGNPKSYFTVLQRARERGWLLTTTFVKQQGLKKQGKCGEDVLPTGLVGGHVYSVLKLVEAHGQQLVCCRNPWGQGEWLGKWSDKNQFGEWTAEMKAATGYSSLNDGNFWMSIEDFVATSGGAEYARPFGPQWRKVTHYEHFQKGSMQATSLWPYKAAAQDEVGFAKGATVEVLALAPGWWYGHVLGEEKKGYFPGNYVKLTNRPVLRYDLAATPAAGSSGPLTAVVMLMQPNAALQRRFYKRKQDGLNYKDMSYPSVQVCVVGPDGKVGLKKEGRKRCVSGELTLAGGGLWRIYALSLDGKGGDFCMRVYIKDGTATLKKVPGATLSEVAAAIAA